MKVLVAEHAGTCYGVQRALDLARKAVEDGSSAQTLGPLIHNPRVVADLSSRGVSVANSPEEVTATTVIIRSHGVTPEVLDSLRALDAEVIDATCPHVLRAQKAAFELAKSYDTVLVVGECGHPEVEGLCAWTRRGGGRPIVVASQTDIPCQLPNKVGVVVQTTQHRSLLNDVLSLLDFHGVSYELRDTICSATSDRQSAARILSSQVDCMVIVGGRNSSNTARLAEICAECAPCSILVESSDELSADMFEGICTVGVTAGASTPEDHIQAVVDCLRSW